MHSYEYHFFGMHYLWWAFWFILIVPFFLLARPVRRRAAGADQQNPLEILQQRYANGRITTQEYEERRLILLRDTVSVQHESG